MSVRTQIDRISEAKQAIITAIRNKRVEVPNGVKIEALAGYIGQITYTVTDDGDGNVKIEGMTVTIGE